MDTKSKRFSRSGTVKGLLLIMYIACFAAIGVITGFAPAYDYMRNIMGFDAMLADNVEDTEIFRSAVVAHERSLMNCVLDSKRDASELVRKADHYIRIETQAGSVYESDIEPYWQYELTHEADHGITGFVGYEGYYFNADWELNISRISLGMSEAEYNGLVNYWLQVKNNMWIILVSDILLLAVGILLMCIICKVTGECPDGTVRLHPFFMVPYEITLGLLILAVIMPPMMTGGLIANTAGWSDPIRTLCMICFGGVFAVVALIFLYLIVCMSTRSKNKRFARGSIIVCMIMGIWYILKWCGKYISRFLRCLKEMMTGELFKGSAAKKLLMIDLLFVIITSFNIIFFVATYYYIGAIWVILEILALGLFVFGRYILLRDMAVLERQIKEMYNGNYAYSEPLHKNSPYAESSEKLYKLASQYRKGIEESVRAERMKIDLVTNVSHDLKTPLTSIISYVELLSREELSPAARDYVTILQQKSTRLKNIVADVFELAKTTSGEIAVANEQLDLNKLSYQTLAEMEDKISRSGFIVKANICDPPVTVVSDGKRIYRIIQNLMDNALKYSLNGTRIYYSLEKIDGDNSPRAMITIKNIASYEMNFTTEEILERFTRGDRSRTTEGSGLGLSIAQGFALACGGDFKIDIDGDMFKAMVSFPLYNAAAQASAPDGGAEISPAKEEIVLPLSPAPLDEDNAPEEDTAPEELSAKADEPTEPVELEEIKAEELLKETVTDE